MPCQSKHRPLCCWAWLTGIWSRAMYATRAIDQSKTGKSVQIQKVRLPPTLIFYISPSWMMTTRHGKAFLNPNNQCRFVCNKVSALSDILWILRDRQPMILTSFLLTCQCRFLGLSSKVSSSLNSIESYDTWRTLERTGGQTAYSSSSTRHVPFVRTRSRSVPWKAKYLLRKRHLIYYKYIACISFSACTGESRLTIFTILGKDLTINRFLPSLAGPLQDDEHYSHCLNRTRTLSRAGGYERTNTENSDLMRYNGSVSADSWTFGWPLGVKPELQMSCYRHTTC